MAENNGNVNENCNKRKDAQRSPDNEQYQQIRKITKQNNDVELEENPTIMDLLKSINANLKGLNERMGRIEERIEEENKYRDGKMDKLEERIKNLERENRELKSEWQRREREEKRLNLILKGLREEENENTSDQINKILEDKLGNKMIHVVKAERIGRRKDGYKRPIVINLKNYEDKILLLKDKKKIFRGTGIYIDEDLTYQERRIKQFLIEKGKEAMKENKRYRIMKNSILINSVLYFAKEDVSSNFILEQGPKNGI